MKELKDFVSQITPRETFYFLATAVVIFLAAKSGQYLFYNWQTSPAVLWPPTGIALSILWLGGYRYTVPIFFGLFAATITGPSAHLVPAIVTTPAAQVLGHITGAYLLRRFKFDGTFVTVRNVVMFLGVIIIACMVAPSITTLVSLLSGNLTVAAYISWSRSWAGYIFSCLILTPLILTWMRPEKRIVIRSVIESSSVGALLLLSVYFLFWTRAAEDFSFLFFALFFIAHFWVSFRFSSKLVTLSMFVTTFVGILGLFLSPRPDQALNSQLFATELFLFLVVPIFYAFSALVKERANTIEELKDAMNKIEKESVIKNDFISVLAHELRNPLAPVKTTLEVLEEQTVDTETLILIKSAHHQVHSMRRLLDDLLDITRVTQGKFKLQIERSHLCGMIESSIAVTKSLFPDRSHTFIIDPVCDDSLWLEVDPVRFEQAIVNVLNNASKYTNPGGRIVIKPIRKNNSLELKIEDNGVGIAKEHLENIFEAFWQVKHNPSASAGGIGVGLSLTRHIVELHGGSIRAESAGKGKGSAFTISMPLPDKGSYKPVVKESSETAIPHCRILVVDDNHAASDSLCKLLTLKGHTAQAVYSGNSAVEMAESFYPELVLLDLGLPDISGYDVARKLRAGGFKNQIVALSGYGQKEDKDMAVEAGCNYHLTKPIAIARLEEYLINMQKTS